MQILEIFEEIAPGYRDEKQDNSVKKMGDLRKTRLTLAQIKRLRMMNDMRKFEEQKKVEMLRKQYKPAAEPGAMPAV
jgi:hypothetical protein